MELILASTSVYRRQLLERLGLSFECLPPPVNEDEYKTLGLPPRQLAEQLAIAKASSLTDSHPHATIIGSDQLATIDGAILGKPGSQPQAIAQLQQLAGRTHELITALAVHHQGKIHQATDVTRLHMRDLTTAEIEHYVQADNPIDCAGSYKLESRGITLFESITSADQTAIIGLPLIALTTLLRQQGWQIP